MEKLYYSPDDTVNLLGGNPECERQKPRWIFHFLAAFFPLDLVFIVSGINHWNESETSKK